MVAEVGTAGRVVVWGKQRTVLCVQTLKGPGDMEACPGDPFYN